jgi:hypothetical protein
MYIYAALCGRSEDLGDQATRQPGGVVDISTTSTTRNYTKSRRLPPPARLGPAQHNTENTHERDIIF